MNPRKLVVLAAAVFGAPGSAFAVSPVPESRAAAAPPIVATQTQVRSFDPEDRGAAAVRVQFARAQPDAAGPAPTVVDAQVVPRLLMTEPPPRLLGDDSSVTVPQTPYAQQLAVTLSIDGQQWKYLMQIAGDGRDLVSASAIFTQCSRVCTPAIAPSFAVSRYPTELAALELDRETPSTIYVGGAATLSVTVTETRFRVSGALARGGVVRFTVRRGRTTCFRAKRSTARQPEIDLSCPFGRGASAVDGTVRVPGHATQVLSSTISRSAPPPAAG